MNDQNLLEDQPIAWTPTPDVIERAQLTKFMRQVGVSTWDELYAYSINDVEKFTEEVLKFLDIKFDPPYEKLLDTTDGIEFPNWFLGRNADTPVRNEGEARTTTATFENKKGWHNRGFLPHFDGVVTQFVTFRLADSLPQNVLKRLKQELERDELSDNSDEYRQTVEDYLDKGIGSCILRNTAIAKFVEATIEHEDGRSCKVISWVIMPNHVHVLLRPLEGNSLSEIIKRIKGVSARRINELRGAIGSVWQPEYFDRYIRDAEHFSNTIRYIENNPVKAGLCSTPHEWRFGSASPQAAIADKSVRVPAGFNITEMCLDRWQTDEMKGQPAVIWEDEEAVTHTSFWNRKGKIPNCLTYGELIHEVKGLSAILRSLGYKPGDAFGIHLPMVPETVIILMALAKIGAIAVPVFSGYGASAIEARLNAVQAKALFTCDGFSRRGKKFDAFSIAKEAVSNCPSVDKVFVVKKIGSLKDEEVSLDYKQKFIDFEGLVDGGGWSSFWDAGAAKTSAEDPLIILYTSGTTGKPKGIAHTHASFPIKAAQDMAFGTDVGKGTRISWYTDIGWMMGPWLIYGALINGATICIYDGAPDYPTPDRMWGFCAKHKVEILGISPTLIRSLAASEEKTADNSQLKADSCPSNRHDLSSLRIFASTGEPWNPAPWWWLFEKVGNSKLPIINYSGGTEISGGILMGNPLLPIKPCSFPAPCPGMDVDILDEDGNPVGPGKVGELVIKQPWIGMARGFWQEKERYFDTYWSRFKNIWVHGDFAMRDKDGHWFILGRSDDTLKVAGKRVGPAEVESLLVAHPLVTEAAVIGVPDDVKGTAMVAFCVLQDFSPQRRKDAETQEKSSPPYEGGVDAASADGVVLSDSSLITHHPALETELKALVSKDMGKPLAPSRIHFVSALPKTRNAKVMRRVLLSAYLGEDPGDLSALENPNAVEEIRRVAR